MSYRRQTRCRHCGGLGHNQRGCEKLKTYAAENPNSYSAFKLKQAKEDAKHRKCSYCASEGHNKKTCAIKLNDYVRIAAANINYRQKFVENIIERDGISPGALINVHDCSGYIKGAESYQYNLGEKLAMVTDIIYDNTVFPGQEHQIKVQFFDVLQYNRSPMTTSLRLPTWYVLGEQQPENKYGYGMNLPFTVVSRSHFNLEEKETWSKDIKAISDIHESLSTHYDVENALIQRN
jgi:hypothetical protein